MSQRAIMDAIDASGLGRKFFAYEIGVDEPTLAHWRAERRPMPVDHAVRLLAVLMENAREHGVEAARGVLAPSGLTAMAAGVVSPSGSPMEVAMTAAVNGGDTVRALQEALADGHISPIEARRIDELAEKHAKTSRDLAALAAEARAQRAMPRMAGVAK
jgi:hypothetical protein